MDLFDLRAMPEIRVEDIERIYGTLIIGSKVRIDVTIYGLNQNTHKEVEAYVREVYPHHAMCEYNGKLHSVQLKDIAFMNRWLL